jgi:hypothetical protein
MASGRAGPARVSDNPSCADGLAVGIAIYFFKKIKIRALLFRNRGSIAAIYIISCMKQES